MYFLSNLLHSNDRKYTYLFDLMLRGTDRLHFSSNEIILKITCADHVFFIIDNTTSTSLYYSLFWRFIFKVIQLEGY